MYSVVLRWNVLYIFVMSIWSSVSFKDTISPFIFILDDVFVDVSRVLKSPTIIVLLSISPFMSISALCT